MSENKNDLRSPIGRVRGLGSAKHGTEHWWMMRLTSLALIPLTLWFVFILLACIVSRDYAHVTQTIGSPFTAIMTSLLLLVGFHHAASGVREIIEDYVHREALKMAALIIVKFGCAVLAFAGVFAVLKIAFGG